MRRSRLAGRRVLVTGGAGFIGSHIVDALLSRQAEVVVLDDLSSGSTANLPPGVRCIQADIASADVIAPVVSTSAEVVIHAAAQVSVPLSIAAPARDRDVNLVGTEHVLEGARRSGAQKIVFLSSGGAIYGQATRARERDAPQPANPYGIHKLAAEGYVRTAGLPYAIARLANVFGPRQRGDLEGGVIAAFIANLRAQVPVIIHGDGQQTRDFVFVRDVVGAILRMAESDRSGTWNVSTGAATSIRTLLAELERIIGPAVATQTKARREGDVLYSCLSNDLIRRDLGWQPVFSLRTALESLARSPM